MIANIDQLTAAIQKVINTYEIPFAKTLECLFRNETTVQGYGGFLSEQWVNCLSPGMQAANGSVGPNYGWDYLAQFWLDNPQYAPTGTWSCVDNDSALSKSTGLQRFIIFPSMEAAFMSIAWHIHNNKADNFGAWFDNNPIDQAKYVAILNTIIPRICDTLTDPGTA